jgi:hypothetical protein
METKPYQQSAFDADKRALGKPGYCSIHKVNYEFICMSCELEEEAYQDSMERREAQENG